MKFEKSCVIILHRSKSQRIVEKIYFIKSFCAFLLTTIDNNCNTKVQKNNVYFICRNQKQFTVKNKNLKQLLSGSLKVVPEPITGLLYRILHGGELEVRPVLPQLTDAGRLLQLPISHVSAILHLPLEVSGLHDHVNHLTDGNLSILIHTEQDRLDLVVIAESPESEAAQVLGENELAEGLASAEDLERGYCHAWPDKPCVLRLGEEVLN